MREMGINGALAIEAMVQSKISHFCTSLFLL